MAAGRDEQMDLGGARYSQMRVTCDWLTGFNVRSHLVDFHFTHRTAILSSPRPCLF